MIWEEILKTLGSSVILVGALAWLAKSLLTTLLSKDLEVFKSDLQVSSQQGIESFKSSLQIETQRRSIEFSALHTKRAEFIAELYAKLQSLQMEASGLTRAIGSREGQIKKQIKETFKEREPVKSELRTQTHQLSSNEKELVKVLQLSTEEFRSFYLEKKIYFSPEICELIEKLSGSAGYRAAMYEFVAIKDVADTTTLSPTIKEFWGKCGDRIPKILQLLEKEFRLLLGVLDK